MQQHKKPKTPRMGCGVWGEERRFLN